MCFCRIAVIIALWLFNILIVFDLKKNKNLPCLPAEKQYMTNIFGGASKLMMNTNVPGSEYVKCNQMRVQMSLLREKESSVRLPKRKKYNIKTVEFFT